MAKLDSDRDSESRQLSLFDPQFDSRIRRITIGDAIHFSVLDVFQHYGRASNPTMAWKTVLKRLSKQGFDSAKEILALQPSGERQRKTPFATLKTMLRIAQVTDFEEWELIRRWMGCGMVRKVTICWEAYLPSRLLPSCAVGCLVMKSARK